MHGRRCPFRFPLRAERQADMDAPISGAWHLYVIRTVDGSLYAGITTDVRRRYREHASGGPNAAKFLRANPPSELVFRRRIGSRSLALKVEYRFKRLAKRNKEAIIRMGTLRFDRDSGRICRAATTAE